MATIENRDDPPCEPQPQVAPSSSERSDRQEQPSQASFVSLVASVAPKTGSSQPESLNWVLRAEYLAFFGVYLYFAGWAYVSSYFTALGLSTLALPVPVYSVFAFAFNVLFYDAINVAALIGLAASGILLYWLVVARWRFSQAAFVPICGVVLFPILFGLGRLTGVRAAEKRLRGEPPLSIVTVQSKTPRLTDSQSAAFWSANDESRLRMLVQTEDRYYLIDSATFKASSRKKIYEIKKADIFSVEILLP